MAQGKTAAIAANDGLQAAEAAVEASADATVEAAVDHFPTTALTMAQRVKTLQASGNAFKIALREFSKSAHNTMKYARICAELAILHFEQHGDLVYAQAFLDNMPKNFVRRAAFLKWLAAFSPVTMSQGKLAKDKGAKAISFNTEKALATPFWDFAPDPENVMWGETDVVKALKSAIRRFDGDNYTPASPAATLKLEAAKAAIAKIS